MPDLDQRDFDIAFSFARPTAAAYRNAQGTMASAPIDTPRFDHDGDGARLGLLIEPGAQLGQADRVTFDPLMLPAELLRAQVTVLHAVDLGDSLIRRAWYSEDAAATINALLKMAGHHQMIGVIAGFRERKGSRFEAGFIRYRHESWYLTRALAADQTRALSDDAGRPLIGA